MTGDDLRALVLRVGSEFDEAESRNVVQSWGQLEDLHRALLYVTALPYVLLERHAATNSAEPEQEARRRLAIEALRDLRAAGLIAGMGHTGSAARLIEAIDTSVLGLRYFARFPEDAGAWLTGGGPSPADMRSRLTNAGAPPAPSDAPISRAAPPVPPLSAMLGEGFQADSIGAALRRLCALGAELALLLAEGLAGAFDAPGAGAMALGRADFERALADVEALVVAAAPPALP